MYAKFYQQYGTSKFLIPNISELKVSPRVSELVTHGWMRRYRSKKGNKTKYYYSCVEPNLIFAAMSSKPYEKKKKMNRHYKFQDNPTRIPAVPANDDYDAPEVRNLARITR